MPSAPSPRAQPAPGDRPRIEWPTVAVAVVIYGSWIGLTLGHRHVPTPLLIILLAVVGAWFGSLQHEVLHGHPFRSRRASDALGWAPLWLWLPYAEYKTAHLKHHRNPSLTDPLDDPESFYVTGESWARAPAALRPVLLANRTLLGRLVFGPIITIAGYAHETMTRERTGDQRRRDRRRAQRIWIRHALGVGVIVAWLVLVAHLPLPIYLAGFVYGGLALTQVRSFAEHRYMAGDETRSATIDASPFWALLFLNNNLHHAHHSRPHAAWYHVPGIADRLGSRAISAEGAGYYRSYGQMFRRYLLRPITSAVHPRYVLGAGAHGGPAFVQPATLAE